MIKLNEKYYLDNDSMNYILMEKKTVAEGDNEGKEYYENISYTGHLEDLVSTLIEKGIKSNIEILYNVEQLIQFKKDMTNTIKNLNGNR
jgi:hypothetical protein